MTTKATKEDGLKYLADVERFCRKLEEAGVDQATTTRMRMDAFSMYFGAERLGFASDDEKEP